MTELHAFPVHGIPEVNPGDDLAELIGCALEDGPVPQEGDILVVTSKILSKSEGRRLRAEDREDAVTAETVRVVATRVHTGGVTRIVQNRLGIVQAAAGVDASNTPSGTVLLLPSDPDASAELLCAALRVRFGVTLGVIVTDTLGRPWREGQTDAAIGASGVFVVDDLRGSTDSYGHELVATEAAVADEIAAAADLVKGKASGVPVALIRGLAHLVRNELHTPARALVRSLENDMFRLGTDEALMEGFDRGYTTGYAAGLIATESQ